MADSRVIAIDPWNIFAVDSPGCYAEAELEGEYTGGWSEGSDGSAGHY